MHPCIKFFSEKELSPPPSQEAAELFKPQWENHSMKPPMVDEEHPPHIKLLKDLEIPAVADIHCHFFPEHILKLIWRFFDTSYWPIAYRLNEAERLQALERNEVRYFTTLNYAHKPGMAASLNSWVSENLKRWPGSVPFGTFFPEPGAFDYVKTAIEDYSFKGFKLHCQVSDIDLNDARLAATFDLLQENDQVLVVHCGTAPTPGRFTGAQFFERFIKRYPRLRVIVAHMGAFEIDEFLSFFNDYENMMLDTTMVFVDFKITNQNLDHVFEVIDKNSERILFGSDFPNIPYNLSHPVTHLIEAPLGKIAKQNILYRNFEKMLL